jgi:hypothetical protein
MNFCRHEASRGDELANYTKRTTASGALQAIVLTQVHFALSLQKPRVLEIQGDPIDRLRVWLSRFIGAPTPWQPARGGQAQGMRYHPAKAGRVNNMAVFLVFWIPGAVNFIKLFKNLAEQGLSWFLEPFVMSFMQLQGLRSHRLMIRSFRFFQEKQTCAIREKTWGSQSCHMSVS